MQWPLAVWIEDVPEWVTKMDENAPRTTASVNERVTVAKQGNNWILDPGQDLGKSPSALMKLSSAANGTAVVAVTNDAAHAAKLMEANVCSAKSMLTEKVIGAPTPGTKYVKAVEAACLTEPALVFNIPQGHASSEVRYSHKLDSVLQEKPHVREHQETEG